jgi:hypothetical protein
LPEREPVKVEVRSAAGSVPVQVPTAAVDRSGTADAEPSWQMLWLCISPATYGNRWSVPGVAASATAGATGAAPRISAVLVVIEFIVIYLKD